MSRWNNAAKERRITHAGNSLSVFLLMAGVMFAASVAEAQTIGLYELARFDLSATSSGSTSFIGSNPIAVGWNGSKLYVAGLNSGTSTVNTSIIEITNAGTVTSGSAAGFVTPTYSSTFGALSSPASRGYTGLAMNGSQLAASFDPGTNSVNGIQMFDAASNVQSWNLSATGTNTSNIGTTRGYAGPDFDPGYLGISGSGSGLGWVTQGAGRRLLNDASTGTPIYVSATSAAFLATWPNAALGMVINPNTAVLPTTTSWRDIAFDPATGNMYMRNQYGVLATNRTGSNSDANPVTTTAAQSEYIYVNTGSATSNNVGINIGFMNSVAASALNGYSGDALVFNDRASTAAGQSWTNVIKFSTTSGSLITPSYTFLSAPAASTAAYDFEWDSTTQTLAVLDYTNRNVSIFSTAVPEPSTCAVLLASLGIGGITALRRRRANGPS